jgi:hypothetical protein
MNFHRTFLTTIAMLMSIAGPAVPARGVDTLKFSETLTDKLACLQQSTGMVCGVVTADKYKVSATVFAGVGFDPAALNPGTPVQISIGGVQFSSALGDDPRYATGGASAMYLLTHTDTTTGKTVIDRTIALKMSTKGVKISLSGTMPVFANQFAGQIGTIASTKTARFSIGSFSTTFDVSLAGKAVQKSSGKGTQTFTLNSVKLKGVGTPRVVVGNRPPVAVNDVASTTSGNPVRIDVLANDSDPDGDPIGAQSFTQPANGIVDVTLDVATYTPNILFTGTDTFTYMITDSRGGTSSATCTVTVTKPPFKVTGTTPENGADEAGVTVRPQVRFSKPVNPATLNTNNFSATALGQRLPATIVPGGNGLFAWLIFQQPMPSSTMITLTVDGASIQSADGEALDADGDGVAGGVLQVRFSTVSLTPVPGTVLKGKIADPGTDLHPMTFDDYSVGVDGQTNTADDVYLLPIAGVKVFILGMEDHAVYSDASGNFVLDVVPSGDVKVVVDGRTATSPPAGYYFPEMVMDSHMQPGLTNTVMTEMATMYLPRVASVALQTVDGSTTTTIGVKPAAAFNLTTDQQKYLTVQVQPGSLIGTNGQPASTGQIGISVVPAELVMDMLPPGLLQHTFDITVQALDVSLFSSPAPMTFPNVFQGLPGQKLNFLSFDHTTGRLVIEGTATVSADGLSVTTDPGTGITHPGWHGLTPPGTSGSGGGGGGGGNNNNGNNNDGNNNKKKNCDTERNLAISGGVQCAVGIGSLFINSPLLGCAVSLGLGAAGSAVDCSIDPAGCKTTMGFNTVGAIVGCIPDVGGPSSTMWTCFLGAGVALVNYNACKSVAGLAPVHTAAATIPNNIFDEQQALWAAAADVYAVVLGDTKWTVIDPVDYPKAQVLFEKLEDALQASSVGGSQISQSERELLLQLPRPGNISSNDVSLLLDRMSALASGQTPSTGLDVAALAAAGSNLVQVATELQNRGWLTTVDAFIRGIPELSAEQDQAFDGVAATGAGAKFASLSVTTTNSAYQLVPRAFYKLTNLTDGFVQRGRLASTGKFDQLFLAPKMLYTLKYVNPVDGQVAATAFLTPSSGSQFLIPRAIFVDSSTTDSDGDGLSDEAEDIIGTDPTKFSTCGDGISDLARVQQDLDLENCLPLPTGIIAALPLPGWAKRIVITGSISNATQQTAYLACGNGGLAIVDVSKFQQPILLGQLALPGDATDVSVDSNLKIAAVAANIAGLHLVDISDPTQPRLLQTIHDAAGQVEVIDGIVYATVGTAVNAYDMVTGALLQSLPVGGTGLAGLARDGFFLYTMDDGHVLSIIDIGGPIMVARGSVSLTDGTGNLFVGGGIAYVAAGTSTAGGFATVDVSNPNLPVLLSGVGALNVEGGAIAVNGSGLAVTVGGYSAFGGGLVQALDVMDVSNPANTSNLVARVPLPGQPYGVAIGGGIAFVADGTNGLQVVNYAPIDNHGIAPVITVAGTATNAVEGSFFLVQFQVSDDVQVRSVELLVNGQVVQNSVSFPFDLIGALPLLSAGSSNVVLQIRATDTGGNITLSTPITVQLVRDSTPPSVTNVDPPDLSVENPGFRSIAIDFSEPVDQTTVNAQSIQLLGNAGSVTPQSIQFRLNNTEVRLTYPELSGGPYQIVLQGPAVKDRAGNALAATNFISHFSVNAQTSAVWINPNSGFWDVAANWASGVVPGPTDDVLIAQPGNITVTFRQGSSTIHSLASSNTLLMTGGSLAVASSLRVDNSFILQGGTLAGATILPGTGGEFVVTNASNPRLSGITLVRDLVVRQAILTIANGLTLQNASMTVDAANVSMYVYFPGTQTLGGAGEVVFTNGASGACAFIAQGPGTLTIGTNITIHGGNNVSLTQQGGASIVNQGTLVADKPGGYLSFRDASSNGLCVNQGTLKVLNGSVLETYGVQNLGVMSADTNGELRLGLNQNVSWSNGGKIFVTNATLRLAGTFTPTDLGTYSFSNASVVVNGTMNNTGTTFEFNAKTGSWTLEAGTIQGGTLTATNGATLLVATGFYATLDGVTFGSSFNLPGARFDLRNGLTLSNTTLSGVSEYRFHGTQTLGGTGEVVLSGPGYTLTVDNNGLPTGATLTIGPAITVTQPGNGEISPDFLCTILNQGTIAGLNGGRFDTYSGIFINAGQLTPGNPPQLMTINGGTFTQQVTGVLNMHIGGTTPGTGYTQIKSTGGVGLDGTLNLILVNGFAPSIDDTFELMKFAAESGVFAAITGTDIGGGKFFQVNYTATNVLLTVVTNQSVFAKTSASMVALRYSTGRTSGASSATSEATNDSPAAATVSSPIADQTNAPINTAAVVYFRDEVAPESISTNTVALFQADQPVAGSVHVSADNHWVTFRPESNLVSFAEYSLLVSNVETLAGDSLESPVVFPFKTSDRLDQDPPLIADIATVESQTRPNTIVVEFNEPLDPSTIDQQTVWLIDSATNVPVPSIPQLGENGRQLIVTPTTELTGGQEYCLMIDCVADIAGNCVAPLLPVCFRINQTPAP